MNSLPHQPPPQSVNETHHTLERIAENIPGVIYQLRLQADGTYSIPYASLRLHDIYGISPLEVRDDAAPLLELIHPDDREQFLQSMIESGNQLTPWHCEHRICLPDGQIKWIVIQSIPERELDGNSILWHGYSYDMTDRKQAELAAQATQAELTALFHAMQDVVVVLDREGRYTKIADSSAPLLYKPPADLIGKKLSELFPPELLAPLQGAIDRALKHQQVAQVEYALPLGGETLWFHASMSPMATGEVVCIARNITDRKHQEEQLRHQNQELKAALDQLKATQTRLIQAEKMSSLGHLVAGIAHEINNPVSFIHGNLKPAEQYMADLVQIIRLYQANCPTPPTRIQEYLESIDLAYLIQDFARLFQSMRTGTERIRSIVRSLKIFSRLGTSDYKVFDLHEGLDSALILLQNRLHPIQDDPAENSDHDSPINSLKIDIDKQYGSLPAVECYGGLLNQAFMSLLGNAIDAIEQQYEQLHHSNAHNPNNNPPSNIPSTPYQGQIAIKTEFLSATNQVRIAIRDNGCGMDETVQAQMLNPFFTTKPVGKGTGMGLATTHQIVVEAHGGQLQCHSQPGLGTEFVLLLPVKLARSSIA
jgi:PAS domain S-box-containing protein